MSDYRQQNGFPFNFPPGYNQQQGSPFPLFPPGQGQFNPPPGQQGQFNPPPGQQGQNFPQPFNPPPGQQEGFGPSPFPNQPVPGGQQTQGGPPTSPPPSFTPQQSQQASLKAVDPGAISGCLYKYTYVWLRRKSFWFYPTYVGRTSVSGYRWNGYTWLYYGTDTSRIQSFQCY